MYVNIDGNSSTFLKTPSEKEEDEICDIPNKNYNDTPEESTVISSLDSQDQSSSAQQQHEGIPSIIKPCDWVDDQCASSTVATEDLSFQFSIQSSSTHEISLEDSRRSYEECTPSPINVSHEEVDRSCSEPGAVEVTVAWDCCNRMVTYVTLNCPITPASAKTTKKKRKSSRKNRRRLFVGSSSHSRASTWNVGISRCQEEYWSEQVRTADI